MHSEERCKDGVDQLRAMWRRDGVVLELAYCVAGDRNIDILHTTRMFFAVYVFATRTQWCYRYGRLFV